MFWTVVLVIVVGTLVVAAVHDRKRRAGLRRIALNSSQDTRSASYRGPIPRDFGGGAGVPPN